MPSLKTLGIGLGLALVVVLANEKGLLSAIGGKSVVKTGQ